jgi:hypothetical protein
MDYVIVFLIGGAVAWVGKPYLYKAYDSVKGRVK